MSRFILRPRFTSVQAVSLATRSMSPALRRVQLQQVRDLRMADPETAEVKRMVRAVNGTLITTSESATPVTGTTVADLTDEAAEDIREARPDVMVVRDQLMPLIDPLRPAGLAAKASVGGSDLWHLDAIGLIAARRDGLRLTGKGVTVAVLDTGVDASHPELAGRVSAAYTLDTDRWTGDLMDPSVDTEGHGTHVAGLICGRTVGVAPDARVINEVMIPRGAGTLSNFVLALEWAAAQEEVRVVNMSAGIRGWVDGMQAILSDLMLVGVLPVIATGNEGRNRTRSPGNYPEVVSVGATNRAGRVSTFSSGGTLVSNHHQYFVPDLVAPGEGVYSSVMGGGYEAWDGTSMATPIVSGVAALILERHPDISVTDLQDELMGACRDLGAGPDRQGLGLIQIARRPRSPAAEKPAGGRGKKPKTGGAKPRAGTKKPKAKRPKAEKPKAEKPKAEKPQSKKVKTGVVKPPTGGRRVGPRSTRTGS